MSARLPVAARAVLTLAGVALTSVLLVIAATEAAIATRHEPVAAWLALGLFVVAGALAWLTVWAAAGRNPLGAPDPSRAARPRRLLVARVLLILAALLFVAFLAGLPLPPHSWREMVTMIAILALLLATAYAALTVTHREPRGRRVALVLGAWMTSQLVGSTFQLSRVPENADAGPGVAWSLLLAWLSFGAPIVAALCVLSLRGAWPPRNTPVTDGVVSWSARRD